LRHSPRKPRRRLYAQHFARFPRDIIHFIQQFQQLRLQLFGGGSARSWLSRVWHSFFSRGTPL
jgi:hypothetical protein